MEISSELADILQLLNFDETIFFDPEFELSFIIQKLIYIMKMQIQPAYCWHHKGEDQIQIIRSLVSSKYIKALSNRDRNIHQHIGHPINPFLLGGLQMVQERPELLEFVD